jgi:putative FmdB family regulatory protein
MPTYEYQCTACGHKFEKFQAVNDIPVKECLKCGGAVEKLISTGGGIVVKGSSLHVKNKSTISCGRQTTCCGRQTPCDNKPCDK